MPALSDRSREGTLRVTRLSRCALSLPMAKLAGEHEGTMPETVGACSGGAGGEGDWVRRW